MFVLVCAGCASFDEYCTGAAAGGAIVGGVNPLGLPCVGYQAAKIGKGIGSMFSGSSETGEKTKTFASSKTIQEAMVNSSETMTFVLGCIDKYKLADYGSASEDQKNDLIGKYVSAVVARPVMVTDKGDHWQVSYEGE